MTTPSPEARPLTEQEWLARYQLRLMEQADLTEAQAREMSSALPFEELCEMFEDDPEGAADEEMSCWEPD